MAHSFYPFVDNSSNEGDGQMAAENTGEELVVRYPARIAVYDDQSAAPRVVVIEPADVRSYLEEITKTVIELSKEQGGDIPFMVIREIVENFIHAYFIEPTISILDGGRTLRFSDQGPGIPEKAKALEYGSSSATKEMKQFIRGVGSGLPYAQQYMVDRGGTLTIEDNLAGGTIVTVSSMPEEIEPETMVPQPPMGTTVGYPSQAVMVQGAPMTSTHGYQQMQPNPYPTMQQGYQGYGTYPQYQGYPQQAPAFGQGSYMGTMSVQPGTMAPGAIPMGFQGMSQQAYPQCGAGMVDQVQAPSTGQMPETSQMPMQSQAMRVPVMGGVSERGMMVLSYLAHNESVGPSDLARAYGSSAPTWSRELTTLEGAGLVHKRRGEQKRVLTEAGRAYVTQLFS